MVIGLSGVQFGLKSRVINRRHEVLLPINRNYNKICDILCFFKLKHKKFREHFFKKG